MRLLHVIHPPIAWILVNIWRYINLDLIWFDFIWMRPNQYELESKTSADNSSSDVVELITTDRSPFSVVIHFHSSFIKPRTSCQSDIWT